LKPLMRIVKFNNMVKELERNTDPNHPDHVTLAWVRANIKPVADRASTSWKKTENARKLLSIHNSISSLPENLQIYRSDRVYVREADFVKFNSKGKANSRHFFLFNDCVIYTVLSTSLLKKNATKYAYKGYWEHNQSSVEDIADTKDIKFAFAVTVKYQKRRIIGAANLNQKKSWMGDIAKYIIASQKAEVPRAISQEAQVASTESRAVREPTIVHSDPYLRISQSDQPADEKRKTVNLQFIFPGIAPISDHIVDVDNEANSQTQAERRKTVNLEFIKKYAAPKASDEDGPSAIDLSDEPKESVDPREHIGGPRDRTDEPRVSTDETKEQTDESGTTTNKQVRDGVDSEIVAIGDALESILDDLKFGNEKTSIDNTPPAVTMEIPFIKRDTPAGQLAEHSPTQTSDTSIETENPDDWKELLKNELRVMQIQLLSTRQELEREVQKRKKLKTRVRAAEQRIYAIEQLVQK